MYFITTKRMLEVCFSAHPNIQYRTPFIEGGELCAGRAGYRYWIGFLVLSSFFNFSVFSM